MFIFLETLGITFEHFIFHIYFFNPNKLMLWAPFGRYKLSFPISGHASSINWASSCIRHANSTWIPGWRRKLLQGWSLYLWLVMSYGIMAFSSSTSFFSNKMWSIFLFIVSKRIILNSVYFPRRSKSYLSICSY